MVDAEKQRDYQLDQMTRQAKVFVIKRLGEHASQSTWRGPRLV